MIYVYRVSSYSFNFWQYDKRRTLSIFCPQQLYHLHIPYAYVIFSIWRLNWSPNIFKNKNIILKARYDIACFGYLEIVFTWIFGSLNNMILRYLGWLHTITNTYRDSLTKLNDNFISAVNYFVTIETVIFTFKNLRILRNKLTIINQQQKANMLFTNVSGATCWLKPQLR